MEGHESEVGSQAALLTQMGFQKVSVLLDQYGRERFLRAEHFSSLKESAQFSFPNYN